MKNFNFRTRVALVAMTAALFSSCSNDEMTTTNESATMKPSKPMAGMMFYALGAGTMLDEYSTSDPENPISSVMITGLQTDETILSIDFRPATGQLYGIGSTSRLYVIDQETGMARAIGSPISPAISGDMVAFDFNPTVDRIRLVTSSGQNLRLNPETGATAVVDGDINGASGAMIGAVAYTGNFAGSSATTLYDIDPTTNKLYKQIPPNNGTLVEVGDLGLNIEGDGGFDISPDQDMALGMFEVNKKSTLFMVDLMTGDATVLAKYKKDVMYTGIAIPTRAVAYASTTDNNLLIFNPQNPAVIVTKPITGLAAGEMVMGIDFRPVNGQIYALGSTSRLYTINASSGAATAAGSPFTTALSGTSFGFDFNPLVDRIRIVSNTGQNLRINPSDGAVIVDGMLNPATTGVTAAAYANNFAGTTSTMLLDIDVNSDKLYMQNPPNAGTLVEIGSLGVNADAASGFDIGGKSNDAYAILSVGGQSALYAISKTTGNATSMGNISGSINGFALGLGF